MSTTIPTNGIFSSIGLVQVPQLGKVEFGVIEQPIISGSFQTNGVIDSGEMYAIRSDDKELRVTGTFLDEARRRLCMPKNALGFRIDSLRSFVETLKQSLSQVRDVVATPVETADFDNEETLNRALWVLSEAKSYGTVIDETFLRTVLPIPPRHPALRGGPSPAVQKFLREIEPLITASSDPSDERQWKFAAAYHKLYATAMVYADISASLNKALESIGAVAGGLLTLFAFRVLGGFGASSGGGKVLRFPDQPGMTGTNAQAVFLFGTQADEGI